MSPETAKTILVILQLFWKLITTWWWLPLPFILQKPFVKFWLFWRNEVWLSKTKRILLEVKMPKELLKPIRAMEVVLNGMWQSLWAPPNWWEKWIDGQVLLSYQLEIVSMGGEPHFYIRTPERMRDMVEANIYSQYPGVEISLADDYTKYVPQDIPNKDWDLFGADYRFVKPNPYPILTYKKFETESEALEEKRVDPIAGLLESMAKIKPGEQLWIQFGVCPLSEDWTKPFLQQAEALRDKLAMRPEKSTKYKPMAVEATEVLLTGAAIGGVEKEKERDLLPPEMKMTPGEKEIVTAIEEKMAKPIFEVYARFIYLGKRDVFFKTNFRLAMNYFAYYATANCNTLVPWGHTLTKIKQNWYDWFWFIGRRLYLRKRRLFRQYKERLSPLFPKEASALDSSKSGLFYLNVEELASLFHFPSSIVAPTPTVSRIEAKRGGAPVELPTE